MKTTPADLNPAPVSPPSYRQGEITLRQPQLNDIERLVQLCAKSDVLDWTPLPAPYTHEVATTFVTETVPKAWANGTQNIWAICKTENDSSLLLGMVGLHNIADGSAEIGYWISPTARGKGYVLAAVQLALNYAFAPKPSGLELEHISWHSLAGNAASAAVARRSGFQFEGRRRKDCVQRTTRVDSWYGSLLSTDDRTQEHTWPDETFVQTAPPAPRPT